MAVEDSEFTILNRREIAASGIGSDPKAVASYEALQNAAFNSNPAAAAAAQETADTAAAAAATADAAATAAQSAADTANASASDAQTRADDAYDLAATKVTKGAGAAWAAPSGTAARTSLAAYVAPVVSNPPTQAEMQALADAVQAISRAVVALVTDLRANEAIKP